jgi:HPt (histidine-containing phosphotransfer) domain-containing protein
MDGLEATAEIRRVEEESGRHTPIIAMTAHVMDGDRERCIEAGMDDYLAKPVRLKDLFETIAKWADRPGRAEAAAPPQPIAEGRAGRRYDGRLRDSYGLDEQCEREVIQEYLASTEERFGRITAAVEADDCTPIVGEAHSIKGSSRTIGDEILGNISEALEHAARRGEIASCRVLLTRARIEFAITRDDLLEYIGQKAA